MSGRRFVLSRESRSFSDWLTRLLNGTVSDNVRLTYEHDPHTAEVLIDTARGERVPLRTGGRRPTVHLGVGYRLVPDPSGRFLMVKTSRLSVSRDTSGKEPLLHYDYERDKTGGYPEAHIHVHATSEPWQRFADRDLHKLHLPVGGRRFRPSLEDLVEFSPDGEPCRGSSWLAEAGRGRALLVSQDPDEGTGPLRSDVCGRGSR